MNPKQMIGKRFGRLIVLRESIIRGTRNVIKYDCKCDCGNICSITGEVLRSGKSRSCGCIKKGRPPNFINDRMHVIYVRIYSNIKKRARLKGFQIDLTIDDIKNIVTKPCFYCGNTGSNTMKDTIDTPLVFKYNGIDRMDSSKGYLKNNIVPCCKYCNSMKGTLTQAQFLTLIKKIYLFNSR